jgi:phage gp45-like
VTPTEQAIRLLKRLMKPLENRVRNMVVRIVVDAVNDAKKFQALKVEGVADEIDDDVEHLQPGGLSHVPLKGAEGVALRVGGRGTNTVALCVSNRSARPKGLQDGETVIYSDGPTPAKIVLKLDGSIECTPGGLSPKLKVNGDIEATGEVTAKSASPATSVTLSQHLHPTAMGPSGTPTPGT